MLQSLSELLADTHKQEPGHELPYPYVNVCRAAWLIQMTLAIYESLLNILRNCYNLAEQHIGNGPKDPSPK